MTAAAPAEMKEPTRVPRANVGETPEVAAPETAVVVEVLVDDVEDVDESEVVEADAAVALLSEDTATGTAVVLTEPAVELEVSFTAPSTAVYCWRAIEAVFEPN
jgi:hypothetical protein